MIYNTGNPVPSESPLDFSDNAPILDKFVNGPLGSYPDRFGVSRQSLQGIRNASQYQILGPYGAGLEFTSYNQVFSSGGEFYSPGAALALPYTTTGSGAGEVATFRSVGDAVLRQDLAATSGAARIGGAGQMVQSISALRLLAKTPASKHAFVAGYYAQGDGGGGAYYLDATDVTSADNGGTVIVATDGGRWKLSHTGTLSLAQFGGNGNGVFDNVTVWAAAVKYCAANHIALYVPDGRFVVSSKAVVDGLTDGFAFVRIFGNGRATGPALASAPVRCGPVIVTTGGGGLEVWFRQFNNEGISIDGVSFYDTATEAGLGQAVAHAVKIKQGDPSGTPRYITNLNFTNMAMVGYEHPIVVQGMYPNTGYSDLSNYVGPLHIRNYYPYRCGSGFALINATANRFRMSESLMFELTLGGIVVDKAIPTSEVSFANATGGSILGALDMVHFEGVQGCFRLRQVGASAPQHSLTLTDVTRELCGVDGVGLGDPYGLTTPTRLYIKGRTDEALAFGENSLIVMPAGGSISSDSPIRVTTVAAGTTLEVLTPETVNNIKVTGTVPASSNITKTITLSNPANFFAFDVSIRYLVGVGGHRVAHVSGTSDFSGSSSLDGAPNPVITELVAFPAAGQVTIKLTNSSGSPVAFSMETVNFTGMAMSFVP